MSGSARLAFFLAIACVVVAFSVFVFTARFEPRTAGRSTVATATHGTPLDPPKPARDFVLRDGDDRSAHVVDPKARITMLFFGYTHCPDTCPLALASLGRAYRTLDASARARTRIVFVTVDPARDRPAVVRAYVRAFDPHLIGLTGTARELADVWRAYGVAVDARTREIGHGDAIYAIDASAHVAYVYPSDTSSKDLAADLGALAR